MKAVAKTMVLVLLLGVMGAGMMVFVSASEDIPPAGYDEPATADFEADADMVNYSAGAAAGAAIAVSDATSVHVRNIENAPALRLEAALVDTDDGADEYPDEDAEYEEPMAINDSPDTGRTSVTLAVSVGLLCCALAPVVLKKK